MRNAIGSKFKGIVSTKQASFERITRPINDKVSISLGTVIAVYSDRMTCDIETSNGIIQQNVPLLASCGLENDEVWGTLDLPSVKMTVLIGFVENRESFPFILGTLFPYAANVFQTDQTPVNSGNKATVLKLLENIHANIYRRIFKSGTTIEVKDDGTIQVETPSGTLLEISESDSGKLNVVTKGDIHLEDGGGSVIEMAASGVTVNEAGGNVIEMTGSSVVINSNLEILQ